MIICCETLSTLGKREDKIVERENGHLLVLLASSRCFEVLKSWLPRSDLLAHKRLNNNIMMY